MIAVLNDKEAASYGIKPGDRISLKWNKKKGVIVIADLSSSKVKPGQVGLFKEIWKKKNIAKGDIVEVSLESKPMSIATINKKLMGKPATYDEIYAVIKDIVDGRLGEIETTYFAASSFVKEYTDDELYYVAKAMAETGEMFDLKTKVVDKHSIGGIPGNRSTPLIVPIIASLGLTIPKTSSRAITSPAGTADTVEVLCPVSFSMSEIKKIIRKTGGCLVWGGGLSMAPADDIIIKVLHPLAMEAYDKMIVSIMAKKVAAGVDYLVVDIPVGPTAKVVKMKTAKEIGSRFVALGKKFKMKVKPIYTKALEPVGRGIGPALETRGILRILQRHELRPRDLEKKVVLLAGELLELSGFCKKGQGKKIAQKQIDSGAAWKKLNQIIVAQGGKPDWDSEEVISGALRYEIHAKKNGKIVAVDNKAIKQVCVNLGAPTDKLAGIHTHVRYGQKVKKGQKLFTMYSSNKSRQKLGIMAVRKRDIFVIK